MTSSTWSSPAAATSSSATYRRALPRAPGGVVGDGAPGEGAGEGAVFVCVCGGRGGGRQRLGATGRPQPTSISADETFRYRRPCPRASTPLRPPARPRPRPRPAKNPKTANPQTQPPPGQHQDPGAGPRRRHMPHLRRRRRRHGQGAGDSGGLEGGLPGRLQRGACAQRGAVESMGWRAAGGPRRLGVYSRGLFRTRPG
jgi:hypothetical protein